MKDLHKTSNFERPLTKLTLYNEPKSYNHHHRTPSLTPTSLTRTITPTLNKTKQFQKSTDFNINQRSSQITNSNYSNSKGYSLVRSKSNIDYKSDYHRSIPYKQHDISTDSDTTLKNDISNKSKFKHSFKVIDYFKTKNLQLKIKNNQLNGVQQQQHSSDSAYATLSNSSASTAGTKQQKLKNFEFEKPILSPKLSHNSNKNNNKNDDYSSNDEVYVLTKQDNKNSIKTRGNYLLDKKFNELKQGQTSTPIRHIVVHFDTELLNKNISNNNHKKGQFYDDSSLNSIDLYNANINELSNYIDKLRLNFRRHACLSLEQQQHQQNGNNVLKEEIGCDGVNEDYDEFINFTESYELLNSILDDQIGSVDDEDDNHNNTLKEDDNSNRYNQIRRDACSRLGIRRDYV